MGKNSLFFTRMVACSKANFGPFLPYLGIFFVLLMGSGLLRIPAATTWFYAVKFGTMAMVLGTGIWSWMRAKRSGRPPLAYLQLALFVPFTIDFHLHYAFILLTVILFNRKLLVPRGSFLKPIAIFFIWGFISYIINQFVEFNPLSFPMFFMTFFLPFIFLGLFCNLTTEETRRPLLDFYFRVLWLVILLIALRVVVSRGGNPDLRTGGTQGTHHAAIFLSIAFLILLFQGKANRALPGRPDRNKTALLLAICPAIFLLDAKYIMVFLAVSILIAATFFLSFSRTARAFILVAIVALLALWAVFTDGFLPLSDSALRDKGFKLTNISKEFVKSPKAKLLNDALAMPVHDPLMFVIGSGPGTFLSRAANSRAPLKQGKRSVSYGSQVVRFESKLPRFFQPFESHAKKKYGQDYQYLKSPLGSIYYWGSSMLNVYFETGIIGLLIFFCFFVNILAETIALRKNETGNDDRILVIALIIFMFLMAFNQLWYEQPSFQIVSYAMLGLFVRRARSDRAYEFADAMSVKA